LAPPKGQGSRQAGGCSCLTTSLCHAPRGGDLGRRGFSRTLGVGILEACGCGHSTRSWGPAGPEGQETRAEGILVEYGSGTELGPTTLGAGIPAEHGSGCLTQSWGPIWPEGWGDSRMLIRFGAGIQCSRGVGIPAEVCGSSMTQEVGILAECKSRVGLGPGMA
jgi:hypothetical protein